MYNLTDKNGWYVNYIKTNKQDNKNTKVIVNIETIPIISIAQYELLYTTVLLFI